MKYARCGQARVGKTKFCAGCGARLPAVPAWAFMMVVTVVIVVIAASNMDHGASARPSSGSGISVIYSVSGTASKASLTYTNQDGGSEQADVRLPWWKEIRVKRGFFAYISAQSKDAQAAEVGVDIAVNGSTVKHSESSGQSVIAQASATVVR
jgi:hypothetical protein